MAFIFMHSKNKNMDIRVIKAKDFFVVGDPSFSNDSFVRLKNSGFELINKDPLRWDFPGNLGPVAFAWTTAANLFRKP